MTETILKILVYLIAIISFIDNIFMSKITKIILRILIFLIILGML